MRRRKLHPAVPVVRTAARTVARFAVRFGFGIAWADEARAARLGRRSLLGAGSPARFGAAAHRRASSIATLSGAPRAEASRLTAAIKRVLTRAIERTSDTRYRSSRFRVYDREGLPCLRAGCGGTIKRRTQAGRSTFYCPVCQR